MHRPIPLPRLAAPVLVLTAAVVGCSDSTAPGSAARLVLTVDTAPGDTAAQLGFALTAARSDSAPPSELRVYVDSATQPFPVATARPTYSRTLVLGVVAFLPGPGRHTVTAALTDSAGRIVSGSFTRTVTFDSVAYAAAPLPDLGAGATAEFIHANGTVSGSVTTPAGRQRPAVWRGGQLAVVAATDSLDATATRVNAAGDVLLQYRPRTGADSAFGLARVLRADGAVLTIGPWDWTYVSAGQAYPNRLCCTYASDLSDARQAVARGPFAYVDYLRAGSVMLDVVTGQVDTLRAQLVAVNGAGQAVGTTATGGLYNTVRLVGRGFTPPGLPAQTAPRSCDPIASRFTETLPFALDDAGNVLARYCGSPALLGPGAGGVFLDRVFGAFVDRATQLDARNPGYPALPIRLSRQGGRVAAFDSAANALYLWRADTRRTARVGVAGGWRLTRLAGVNAGGAIAAEGLAPGADRPVVLVLTPAAP